MMDGNRGLSSWLTGVFCLLVLAMSAGIGRAQYGSDSSQNTAHVSGAVDGFSAVEASAGRRLEEALAELTALRDAIAAEKIPLGRQLSELEDQLLEVTREYQEATRLLDNRTLDLSNLRNQIELRQEERTYVSNLLGEYIRNLETRLHIAENQRYEQMLETAIRAAENDSLSEIEVYEAQAAMVTASLDRLYEALGGTRFAGRAVDASGSVEHGTFVMVGPVALFRSDDGETVGTAEMRLGSSEPAILGFDSDALTGAAAEVVTTGMGNFPLDPTLGKAHKIEATEETLGEHIGKGGVVMYPILGLFTAAMLVVIYKWIELARIRRPSERRVRALLEAVASHDKQQAAIEARAIGGPSAAMLSAGVEHLDEPPALIEEVMYEKILTAKLRVQRLLPFVAITAAAAPLLGLLGTVTGIINTFKLIMVFGSGDVKTLSGGISEALITTEWGLIVAIPSLLLHAFLSRKARGIIVQMEKVAIALVNQVSKTPHRSNETTAAMADMPGAVADEVVRRLSYSGEGAVAVRKASAYAANSAGSMMKPAIIKVNHNSTVAEALEAIRTAGVDEDFHAVFVVDEYGKYVGDLHIRMLLTRPEQARIDSLVDRESLFVRVDTNQEEVRDILKTHDLKAVPVLDQDGQLVGRVIRNGE
jgi:biopolymer transport protein ExbB